MLDLQARVHLEEPSCGCGTGAADNDRAHSCTGAAISSAYLLALNQVIRSVLARRGSVAMANDHSRIDLVARFASRCVSGRLLSPPPPAGIAGKPGAAAAGRNAQAMSQRARELIGTSRAAILQRITAGGKRLASFRPAFAESRCGWMPSSVSAVDRARQASNRTPHPLIRALGCAISVPNDGDRADAHLAKR